MGKQHQRCLLLKNRSLSGQMTVYKTPFLPALLLFVIVLSELSSSP